MSMTDRELIELAAKAASIIIDKFGKTNGAFINGRAEAWSPLVNDGDALRLAVMLGIRFRWHAVLNQALAWPGSLTETLEVQENGEDHSGDKFAATRRAIVRAAAEIGKAMQEKK